MEVEILTIELDEEREIGTVGVDDPLSGPLIVFFPLAHAVAPRGIDSQPLNLLEVGDRIALDQRRRRGVVVGLLRFFELLVEVGETSWPVLANVLREPNSRVLRVVVDELGRGGLEKRDRVTFNEKPAE